MTQTANDRRELAVLFSIILKHPAMTPVLIERICEVFSEVHPQVDAYASPEGIELYLEAWHRLDPGPVPAGVSV